MGKVLFSFVLLSLTGALFVGCDTIGGILHPGASEPDVKPTFQEAGRIRPGVALIVQVGTPSSPPVVVNVEVDQNGDVTMPLLLQEPVACDGLSLEAFKQKLVKAYSAYYRQPQITVTFAPFDGRGVSPWGTVTVMGEVLSPGPVNIPSTMELTVTKALQMAGGVKPYADTSAIRVSRCDKDGRITRTNVDLKEIGKDGRADKDMTLRAGDVLWVPETWY